MGGASQGDAGMVVAWGGGALSYIDYTVIRPNIVAAAAGVENVLLLTEDGEVIDFSLRGVPASATNVAQIASGWHHHLVLRKDGTVAGWGSERENFGQWLIPAEATNIVSVAGGARHSLLLRSDGTVIALGPSVYVPSNVTNIIGISAGKEHSLALTAQRTVLSFGWAHSGADMEGAIEMPGLRDVKAVAAGEGLSIALREDGTVVTWTPWSEGFKEADGLANVVAVVAGRGFAALLATGEVRAWGGMSSPPAGLKGVTHLSAGLLDLVAVTSAPFLAQQPRDLELFSGENARLETSVRSPTPFTCQWYQDDVAIPGATNVFLDLLQAGYQHAGRYRLSAANARLENSSREAVVHVSGPPELLAILAAPPVLSGDQLRIEARFVGHPAPDMQWWFNGLPLVRETNAVLLVENASEDMSGEYSLTLANAYGVVESPQVAVEIKPSPPRIVEQPVAPGSLPDGAPFQLRSEVRGSLPLAFQWYHNEKPISGATSPILHLPHVFEDNDGVYRLEIVNAHGSASTAPATLRTFRSAPRPEILTGNRVVRAGRDVVYEVWPGGTPGAAFQWRFEGSDLPSETNSALVLRTVNGSMAGAYSVLVSNAFGAEESPHAQLRVLPASGQGLIRSWGIISGAPNNIIVEAVAVGNLHGLGLQPDGKVIGWGNDSYGQATVPPGLSDVAAIAAGQDFSLALKTDGMVIGWGRNDYGQASPPPGLRDVIGIAGGGTHALALTADGTVVAWGNSVLTAVPAEATNVVEIAAASSYSLALRGDGTVVGWGDENFSPGPPIHPPALLSNIIAIAASDQSAHALNSEGVVHTWGASMAAPGNATNIAAIAGGSGYLAALSRDGKLFSWGAQQAGRVPEGISNILAVAARNRTTAAISGELVILSHPEGVRVKEQSPVTLSVRAVGSPPLTYQWFRNNLPLAGGTARDLFIPTVGIEDQGMYRVEARNPFSTVLTGSVMVEIGRPPVITTQPADVTTSAGSNVTFTVEASGSPLLEYKWKLNGTNLSGVNLPTLTLQHILRHDHGTVSVEVRNEFGSVSSREARMTVLSESAEVRLTSVRLPGDAVRLVMQLEPNRQYQLLTSTNLLHWVELQDLSAGPTQYELIQSTTNGPCRFYRLEQR
jgi:alpha-tubulin suppressor-like RCC1 family protein